MADEKLTPERAVRLLRAKGGELEAWVLHNADRRVIPAPETLWRLTADIALIAQLLADHIERTEPVGQVFDKDAIVTWKEDPSPTIVTDDENSRS